MFNEGAQYWTQMQQQGRKESLEVALLEPHGGDLGALTRLRASGVKGNGLLATALNARELGQVAASFR